MPRWNLADMPDQRGRTVLVTGANSGLGLRTSEGFAQAGAKVLLACRNADRAQEAQASVAAVATGPAPEVVLLDLSDLASVEACAKTVRSSTEALDVLVNNAGVMALPLRRTAQDHEMHFGTNHLGHFALTGRLLGLLLAADVPRVVTVSSQAHRFGRMRWTDPDWRKGPYSRWMAYGQSKLANLLFTAELQRQADDAGSPLVAVAAHPGYAHTHLSLQGPEMRGNRLQIEAAKLRDRLFAQDDAMGALPQLYAATMPDVAGNDYWGPDGPFEQRGWPTRVKRSRAASDDKAARRLWTLSEEQTGVTYDWGRGIGPKRPAR
jgi:NAD(P)-dependent dehydrogenase (short-subunit alcohol dehydrogenase family)